MSAHISCRCLVFMLWVAGLWANGLCAQPVLLKRPVTLVVPFAPGGGTDAIARDLAKPLSEKLGVPVVIDNRGGAGGSIAAQQVSLAKPDGYTLLFVTSTFVTSAATDRKLPYDVALDFTPIAKLGSGPLLLVVHPQTGITSVSSLMDAAKTDPNRLNYVSAGLGSVNHLAAELFAQRTGTHMTHLPYKGSGPATMDLIGGQAQVFFATVPTILSHVKAGKVRLLATTTKSRAKLFPQVPSVMEMGVKDFDVGTWWGVVGPKDMPSDLVLYLNRLINESASNGAMGRRFQEEGAELFKGTAAEFSISIKQELDDWRKVVNNASIKID